MVILNKETNYQKPNKQKKGGIMAILNKDNNFFTIAFLVLLSIIIIHYKAEISWAGANASSGCALDLDISTRDYDDKISTKDIEQEASANINDEIYIGVIAQNVQNLDTYDVNISFDSNRL